MALGAAGCGTASGTVSGGPGRAQLAELSDAQQITVARAQEQLTKQCMADRGFWYRVAVQPTGDELHVPGYVLDDPRWAREHGYGGRIQRAQERARTADPDVAYYRTLSPERRLRWSDALFGGQCCGAFMD
ncbi:hypothetical protein [Streptomyces sp. NPDC059010]|uniref:hypothetical protein n=1 Tax=Streptomyces sp. NPDC059010 TaxID=3346695 RepID=UPI00369E4E37